MKSKKRLNLSKDKYSGSDVLDADDITSLHEFIKMPLQKIFNESLTLGIFPKNMEKAKMAPISKSSKNELLTNYRLISVLCVSLKCWTE